jgi:cobalt-zinc-cadmium efflux system outer membrane protein
VRRSKLWTLPLLLAACRAPQIDAAGAADALALELGRSAQVESEVERLLALPLDEAGAVRVTLLSNRRVRAQLDRLEAARARVERAGLPANPGLSLGAGWEGGSVESFDFSVAQDVLSALLLPLRVELARGEHARVAAEVADALAQIALEARTAFHEAVAAGEVERRRAEVAEAAAGAAELARRMHAAGNLSDRDYVAEIDAAEEARLAHAEAAAERIASGERLRRVLGTWAPGARVMLPESLPPLPGREAELQGLERRALAERADLAVAVRSSELAAAELGLARDWSLLGFLELGVQAEREDGEWTVGPELALELPLFERGSQRQVELAAELARADHEVFALALEVRSQVREAREQLRAVRARAEHARDVRLPAREALLRLAQEEHDYMLAGAFDLLDARAALDLGRIEEAGLRRDYWIARARLERAVGGALAEPEPESDHSLHTHHHHGDA